MSKLLNIYLKDTYAVMEFSGQQVKYILDFLGKCNVEYDGNKEPNLKEAVEYVTGLFFQTLENVEMLIKEMRNGT